MRKLFFLLIGVFLFGSCSKNKDNAADKSVSITLDQLMNDTKWEMKLDSVNKLFIDNYGLKSTSKINKNTLFTGSDGYEFADGEFENFKTKNWVAIFSSDSLLDGILITIGKDVKDTSESFDKITKSIDRVAIKYTQKGVFDKGVESSADSLLIGIKVRFQAANPDSVEKWIERGFCGFENPGGFYTAGGLKTMTRVIGIIQKKMIHVSKVKKQAEQKFYVFNETIRF